MAEVIHTVSTYYHYMGDDIGYTSVRMARNLDHALEQKLNGFINPLFHAWTRLRKNAYILANAGAQQAIHNCGLGKGLKRIDRTDILNAAHGETEFGSVQSRIVLNLHRIRRDVMDAVQLSKVLKSDWASAEKRILRVFPMPENRVKLRVLPRSYKEADKMGKDSFNFNVDDEDWDSILDDYMIKYVPKWRITSTVQPDPARSSHVAGIAEPEEGEEGNVIYGWQLERDITNDFVQSVRDGENDGATASGVTDFVWVAVLDDRTDECCEERDGLTTSQIEEQIHDDYDAYPPIHPNCRCRLVPAADGLEEIANYTSEEFQNWLEE
jgi:hypothetical protein